MFARIYQLCPIFAFVISRSFYQDEGEGVLFWGFFQLDISQNWKIRWSLFDWLERPQIHPGNFGFGTEEWEEMMTKSSSPFWVGENRIHRTWNTENVPNTNKLKLSNTVTFSILQAPFSTFWNNEHHCPEAATTDGSSSHLKVLRLANLTEYTPISSLVLFLCQCMQEGILESSSPAQRLYRLCSHCQRELTYDCTVKKMALKIHRMDQKLVMTHWKHLPQIANIIMFACYPDQSLSELNPSAWRTVQLHIFGNKRSVWVSSLDLKIA